MKFNFKKFCFKIHEEKILLLGAGATNESQDGYPFVEVQISGEPKGVKLIGSSERDRLKYVSHALTENRLEIVQRSALVEVKTIFIGYENTDSIRVFSEIRNISKEEIVLEEVSSFVLPGLGATDVEISKNLYFFV